MAGAPEGGLRRGGHWRIILPILGLGIMMTAFLVIAPVALPAFSRGIMKIADNMDRQPGTAAYFPEAAPVFHSDKADKAVTVPFTLHSGGIVAPVDYNGWMIPSLIDTGTRDIATNLEPSGRQLEQSINYPLDGAYVPATYREMPSLRLGDYELQHAPIVMVPRDHSNPNRSYPAWAGNEPLNAILGNYAFRNSVLTIDYRSRTLTLHPSDYDIARLPHRSQDSLLDITLGGNNTRYSPEYLAVKGKLAGRDVDFVLDTGHSNAGILISPALREKLTDTPPGGAPAESSWMFGQEAREQTRPLPWSIGNARGSLPGIVIPMRTDWQALIGYEGLKDYRVTIDYVRKKVLLEPQAPLPASHTYSTSTTVTNNYNFPPCPSGDCCTYSYDAKTGSAVWDVKPCADKDRGAASHPSGREQAQRRPLQWPG